jgi:hypothetical protein
MTKEFIPAITAIGGVVIGFLFGMLKDWFQRKSDAEEKFFYDVYHRRIALYEDVIKELNKMQEVKDLNKIKNIFVIEIAEIILEKIHILSAISARLTLFGSANSKKIITTLLDSMFVLHDKALLVAQEALLEPQGNNIEFIHSLYAIIEIATNAFILVVSEDVSNLADEKIAKFLKKLGYKKAGKKEKGEDKEKSEEKQNKKMNKDHINLS